MPEQTKEVVVSGFLGLIVVLATRNEIIPAMLKTPPARAISTAATARTSADASINGVSAEIPHMATAISAATAGGGIFSSSACMQMMVRHNDRNHRAATGGEAGC